jgi:hypothetical protein
MQRVATLTWRTAQDTVGVGQRTPIHRPKEPSYVGARTDGRALNAPASSPKPLLERVRRWFAIDVFVLAAAGVQCFILATSTDRWFAWTVSPPISAAVLGAGYFGSIVMVFEARNARRWVDARIVILSTLLFASLTLAVTLLHFDKFHFDTGANSARVAAYA